MYLVRIKYNTHEIEIPASTLAMARLVIRNNYSDEKLAYITVVDRAGNTVVKFRNRKVA